MIPASALRRADKWQLTGGDQSFGTSLSGRQQFAAGVSPLWVCELQVLLPRKDSADLAWEAWVAQRRGRLVPDAITPTASRLHEPFAVRITPFIGDTDLDNADSLVFADLALFVGITARQFATIIRVSAPDDLTIGKFIFINGAMYRVVSIAGNSVEIQPPLRQTVVSGTPVSATGAINMTLAGPDEGVIAIEPEAVLTTTVTLIEAQ